MAIFSFRPPPPGASRRRDGDVPTDWAETMPSLFDDGGDLPARPAFVTDEPPSRGLARLPDPLPQDLDTLPLNLDLTVGGGASSPSRPPDPGFAKNLTARPHNDDGTGTGWYLSSWDLMQGLEVIEGTPIELLPPEWQRKRPRY